MLIVNGCDANVPSKVSFYDNEFCNIDDFSSKFSSAKTW